MKHRHFVDRRPAWDDAGWAHRAVMSLFPRDLPGPKGVRRCSAGVLFRVDRRRQAVLVQSLVQPLPKLCADPSVDIQSLAPLLDLLSSSSNGLLTVTLNAVKTVNVNGRPRRQPVPVSDLGDWVVTRVPGVCFAKEDIVRLDHRLGTVDANGTRVPLNMVDVTARVRITSPEALRSAIVNGVGRGKAYGCGMVCVVPVS